MKKETTDYNKYKKQKIKTYVSVKDVARLRLICKKYGFKSIYQLLQYLVYCFLRVADLVNDPIDELKVTEINEMFTNNTEWETQPHTSSSYEGMYVKPKPDQRKIKTPDDIK